MGFFLWKIQSGRWRGIKFHSGSGLWFKVFTDVTHWRPEGKSSGSGCLGLRGQRVSESIFLISVFQVFKAPKEVKNDFFFIFQQSFRTEISKTKIIRPGGLLKRFGSHTCINPLSLIRQTLTENHDRPNFPYGCFLLKTYDVEWIVFVFLH